MKNGMLRRLAEKAELTDECLPRQPLLELFGENRVLIENHQGITEYGKERIRVRVKYGCLCICGRGLWLCRMQGQQLIVRGHIDSVQILRG